MTQEDSERIEEILVMLLNDLKKGRVAPKDPKIMFNLIEKVLTSCKIGTKNGINYRLNPGRWEYTIFLKNGMKDKIKEIKKCRSDRELASLLDITPSYLSQLDKQTKPATKEVIVRTAVLLGNIDGNWDVPFEIVPVGEKIPTSSPKNNMKKFNGEVPYENFSGNKREEEI